MDKTEMLFVAGVALALLYVYTDAKKAAAVVGNAVNPVNPDNIINRGVSGVGAAVTGADDWSLGTQLHKWFGKEQEFIPGPVKPVATRATP